MKSWAYAVADWMANDATKFSLRIYLHNYLIERELPEWPESTKIKIRVNSGHSGNSRSIILTNFFS